MLHSILQTLLILLYIYMQCIWISTLVLEMSYCSFYSFLHPQDKIDTYACTKRRTREGTCGSV